MRFSTLATVVALGIVGCASSTPVGSGAPPSAPPPAGATSAQPPVEVELRFDETVESRGLELRWLEIEDSRCPKGVTCIWEGQVVVTLEVARGEDEPVEVALVNHPGREPEAVRAFDRELRLLGVEPHPEHGVTTPREAYLARIEIAEP
jgi:hypothetical protein